LFGIYLKASDSRRLAVPERETLSKIHWKKELSLQDRNLSFDLGRELRLKVKSCRRANCK